MYYRDRPSSSPSFTFLFPCDGNENDLSKDCARIAVKELINEVKDHWDSDQSTSSLAYWTKVKEELEAL